jgi:hypothetical protein
VSHRFHSRSAIVIPTVRVIARLDPSLRRLFRPIHVARNLQRPIDMIPLLPKSDGFRQPRSGSPEDLRSAGHY